MRNLCAFFTLSSFLLVVGCSYSSQGEAFDACEEWKEEGKNVEMEVLKSKERDHLGWEWGEPVIEDEYSLGSGWEAYTDYEVVLHQRVCVLDEATRQVLGRNNLYISDEFDATGAELPDGYADWSNYKVVKHFKY